MYNKEITEFTPLLNRQFSFLPYPFMSAKILDRLSHFCQQLYKYITPFIQLYTRFRMVKLSKIAARHFAQRSIAPQTDQEYV